MNLWHDIKLGDKSPEEFNCIIEVPKGSHNKYEIDKETGLIKLDRANYGASPYPFDYGFAPQTLWEDNDPLDIVLFTTSPIHPGVLVKVRPVGMLRMIDDGESDNKILAVPAKDQRWNDVKDLGDLNKHTLKEVQDFFKTYKNLKGKEGTVEVEEYQDANAAKEAVKRSVELYNEKFGN